MLQVWINHYKAYYIKVVITSSQTLPGERWQEKKDQWPSSNPGTTLFHSASATWATVVSEFLVPHCMRDHSCEKSTEMVESHVNFEGIIMHQPQPFYYWNHVSDCSVQCTIGTKIPEMTVLVPVTNPSSPWEAKDLQLGAIARVAEAPQKSVVPEFELGHWSFFSWAVFLERFLQSFYLLTKNLNKYIKVACFPHEHLVASYSLRGNSWSVWLYGLGLLLGETIEYIWRE